MQLIYIYIDNIDRNISKVGVNFGVGFEANYLENCNKLIIKKFNNKQISYGDNIKSIDLLVGKNGLGKSTILDLLALPKDYRRQVFNISKENYSWFCIYHISNNIFSAEGCGIAFEKFQSIDNKKLEFTKNLNSIYFIYDFEKIMISERDLLMPNKDTKLVSSLYCMYYAYYKVYDNVGWLYKNKPNTDTSGGDCIYRRVYLGNPTLPKLFNYLGNNSDDGSAFVDEDIKSITSGYVEIKLVRAPDFDLSIETLRNNEDIIERASVLIYNNSDISVLASTRIPINSLNINNNIVKKEFIIKYLEDTLYMTLTYPLNNIKKDDFIKYDGKANDYCSRIKFLIELIKKYCDGQVKEITEKFWTVLSSIPESCFIDSETIGFNLKKEKGEWVDNIAEIIETNNSFYELSSGQIGYFRSSFKGLSSGEAYKVDIYASLYNLIGKFEAYKDCNYTCILVLDEPDARFHPEWSRRFIKNLTEKLSSEQFKNYNFQIIISTHSPYFVTDVESEHINCLEKIDDNIVIKKAKNGFMCQLGNIFMDDFFVKSVFGAFSEEYVNNIIKDLNELVKKLDNNDSIDNSLIKPIEEKIIPIKDRIISNALNSKISYLKRRIENK